MNNNAEGRFKKSGRNIAFSLISQIVIILFEALTRKFFLMYFSKEYLGLGSTFSSVLNILSFAELGIGSAIVFSLYKPIAENDEKKICSLMSLYKKTYFLIGLVVLVAGSLLTPILNVFVKEMPDLPYINIIYLLFVFQSGSQYFFSYKITFLNANQQNHLFQKMQIVSSVVKLGLQLVAIIVFKNYILYLCIGIFVNILLDIVCSFYVSYKYPFLKKKAEKLDSEDVKTIKKNVFALLLYRIGNTLTVTIDTIVISKMLGVEAAAIYANYHLIITYSDTFFSTVLGTITPSIGNFMVDANTDRKRSLLCRLQNIYSWITTYAGVGMIVCFNPLITAWLGEPFLLSQEIVVALVISLSLTNFQRPCSLIRDANGLFWYGKLRPFIMAIINVVCSVVLTYYMGMIGVVIGTIISKISTFVWYDPYIVHKYVMKDNAKKYFANYFEKWLIFIILAFACYGICERNPFTNEWLRFGYDFVVVTILVNVSYYFLLKKNNELDYLTFQLRRFFKK